MQSQSSLRSPQPHHQQHHPTFVSIDQHWISSHQIALKESLLTCPICYTIPIDYPIQCAKCQRIFCKKDYEKVTLSQNYGQNRCPTCKSTPWTRKQQIHITYKHMFDSLRLKCKICEQSSTTYQLLSLQNENMTKQQLIDHLQEKHDMFLSLDSILYDYTLVSQQGVQMKLNWIQNLQINVRKTMNFQVFEIGGNAGKVLTINLKQLTSQHPTLGKCKVHNFKSKTLKRNKEYIIWTVDIGDKTHIDSFIQHDLQERPSYFSKSENHRYVFYSEELQGVIERSYQEYVKNQRLNQFCLDVRETRFRISLEDMSQTNTYTKSKKPILRVPFMLR